MKKTRLAALAISLAVAGLATPAISAGWKAVPPEARNPKAPLPIAVHLVQNELRIGVDPSLGPAPNNYGLIGALMIGAMESGQSKKARAEVEPLLRALGEFDAGAPLMAGIRGGISGLPWFSVLTESPLRDNSTDAKNRLLDKVSGDHLVDVDCSYNMGQSFEAIYARCTIQIADKRIMDASPNARWKTGNLLLDRAVQTEVTLDMSSASPPLPHCFGSERREICRAEWAEDAASLLRKELGFALEKLGSLVGRSLNLSATEADISTQPKNRMALSVMHLGPVLEGAENVADAGRISVWSGNKPAVLKPNSDGTTIVEGGAGLYHRRVVAAR